MLLLFVFSYRIAVKEVTTRKNNLIKSKYHFHTYSIKIMHVKLSGQSVDGKNGTFLFLP